MTVGKKSNQQNDTIHQASQAQMTNDKNETKTCNSH